MIDNVECAVDLAIYIAPHCANCDYALAIAAQIRQHYPDVHLRVIDMSQTDEPIPEEVFATPTYLLNGQVWSLGNPSDAQIHAAFGRAG